MFTTPRLRAAPDAGGQTLSRGHAANRSQTGFLRHWQMEEKEKQFPRLEINQAAGLVGRVDELLENVSGETPLPGGERFSVLGSVFS